MQQPSISRHPELSRNHSFLISECQWLTTYTTSVLSSSGTDHDLLSGQCSFILGKRAEYAATVHQVTGYAVAVAFDAGNLLPVALNLHAVYPDHQFVMCSDDDRQVEGNPGLTKAMAAAQTVGGQVLWPRFSDPHSSGSDFNDLCLEEGANSVLSLFNEKDE